MLHRARDAEPEVQRRLDDLAGLADLAGVRDPAGIDRRPRGADDAAQLGGQLLDDAEALRAADAAAADDDDPRLLERRLGARLGDPVEHRDRRASPARPPRPAARPSPALAAGAASTALRRTVTIAVRRRSERCCA